MSEPTAGEGPERKDKAASPRTFSWEPAAMLGLSLLLTVLGWWLLVHQVDRLAEARFRGLVRDLSDTVNARLNAYEQLLRGGAAFMDASVEVTRAEWRTYVGGLRVDLHSPGIQGIGFATYVPPHALAAHEAAVRAEGFPGYTVTPPGPRDSYFPILFLEPFSGRNLRAFGYDMHAEPTRRAAMDRARDEGRPVATGKVTLVQETAENVQAGFLIYVPVYDQSRPMATVTERRAAIRGFVYSPFRMNDLMESILTGGLREHLHVRLYDGTTPAPEALMFDSVGEPGGRQHATSMLNVFGRRWRMEITATPAFEATVDRRMPLIALVAGLVISILIGAVTRALLAERQQAAALRRSYAAVARASAEAEHANAAKSRFLAAASHDLRQPLQTLGIYLHLIAEHPAAAGMRRLVDGARDGYDAAQRMLNALMDIAALESGAAHPQIHRVDLPLFLARLGGELRTEAEAKGLTLRIRLRSATVETDPTMLERIVRNLLHNALKYTRSGTILLSCHTVRGGAMIKVQDTGPGIPRDRMHLIFEDFYQVGNPERDRSKGLGLGLATVARLTRLLGYRVRVLSRLGRGTIFLVELPAGHAAPAEEPARLIA
ncbi:MAG TPA: CHASE domain-containing protein [Azospirillum sp.]|nr:CHASE domain-containing protein [Azospirillum sp.]